MANFFLSFEKIVRKAGETVLIWIAFVFLNAMLTSLALASLCYLGGKRLMKKWKFKSIVEVTIVLAIGLWLFTGVSGALRNVSRINVPGMPIYGLLIKWTLGIGLALLVFWAIRFMIRKSPSGNTINLTSLGAKGKSFKTAIAYVLLNLLVFILFPEDYGKWVYTMWFWQMQIGLVLVAILFAYLSENTVRPWFHYAGLAVFLFWIFKQSEWKPNFLKRIPTSVTPLQAQSSEGGSSGWDWNKSSGPERDTVMLAFPSDTTAWKIAAAESDFTQFWVDPISGDSTLVKNPQSSAVGIFQIMESEHGRDCGQEGLDIYTTAGNIACAKILMARNPNYSDWESSAEKWQNAVDINPCDPFADLGGMSRMRLVKRDTVITTGDTSFTRRMSTENLVLNWELIRTRRDFIVRYGYSDPATGQAKVEERAVRKLLCLEKNRLDVYPDWVEFRSLDENKLAVEVSYYQPLNRY